MAIRYLVNNLDREYAVGSIAIALGDTYFRLTDIAKSVTHPKVWEGKLELVKYGAPIPEAAPTIILGRYLSDLRAEEILDEHERQVEIARLNDDLRHNLRTPPVNCKVVMTQGISQLPHQDIENIIDAIAAIDTFEAENDPYGEHDFGSIDTTFAKVFWKIDYFDLQLKFLSPDPADPAQTIRTITIMLSEEY
jgi:hypothetical protein